MVQNTLFICGMSALMSMTACSDSTETLKTVDANLTEAQAVAILKETALKYRGPTNPTELASSIQTKLEKLVELTDKYETVVDGKTQKYNLGTYTIVTNKYFSRWLPLIYEGISNATSTNYSLLLIPDNHPDAVYKIQTEQSLQRQRQIVQILETEQSTMVFREGQLHLQNFEPEVLNKHFSQYDAWWKHVDTNKVKIVGADDYYLNYLAHMVKELTKPVIEQNPTMTDWALETIFQVSSFREMVMLRNAIDTMKTNGVNRAAMVLGGGHEDSFRELCREWGVQCTVSK